jgi:hypothetical protein
MTFTQHERDRLTALADVLIPVAGGHLSASQADVGGRGLNQVLATCPEMAGGLRDVLQRTGDLRAPEAVADLRQNHPASFSVLAEFAAGAYFLNSAVRDAIRYTGQTARPIEPTADYLEDGLLDSVVSRGPIYRPTPVTPSKT